MPGFDAAASAGVLFLVSTPIGNLGDVSTRSREVLAGVDGILAEDTRHTGRLLAHLEIKNVLSSLHEHNERGRVKQIVEQLQSGKSFAVVSDAGTPLVSDPGHLLVRDAAQAGVTVTPIPGPSAALAALVASGLSTERFVFDGFLPRKGKARTTRLECVAQEPRTTVLFLSPHRAAADLGDLAAVCGPDRQACLAREITKMHEEFLRGSLGELADIAGTKKGEMVLVVAGRPEDSAEISDEAIRTALAQAKADGLTSRDAIKTVAARLDVPKNRVYGVETGSATAS